MSIVEREASQKEVTAENILELVKDINCMDCEELMNFKAV